MGRLDQMHAFGNAAGSGWPQPRPNHGDIVGWNESFIYPLLLTVVVLHKVLKICTSSYSHGSQDTTPTPLKLQMTDALITTTAPTESAIDQGSCVVESLAIIIRIRALDLIWRAKSSTDDNGHIEGQKDAEWTPDLGEESQSQ